MDDGRQFPQNEERAEKKVEIEIPKKAIDYNPLVRTVTRIINDGVKQHASDILIEPQQDELQIRFRIDGVLSKSFSFDKSLHESVVTRIKVMSALDISEHRLPQDGRFKIVFPEKEIDVRVSIIPSNLGEKIALRILDKETVILDINKLCLDEHSLKLFKNNLIKPYGMILVCGPTGCGKTTTLYSALEYINSVEKNILTVEDPIEYQLKGINQVAVFEDIGLTFAAALRSILRQDPNIILVGEIRDFETADMAIKAALTGHLILSTLHTTSAVASVVRLTNMGIEPFLVASSCLLIASQILIRTLCPQCKEGYHPSKTLIDELRSYHISLSDDIVLYKERGCNSCSNTGFKGRTAVMETLEITPAIGDLIIKDASEKEIKETAKREGTLSLRENGLNFVIKGITTLEELFKATSAE
ncbi:MAG: GspE/PulE family protein [Candidatus Omnitrophota bacterium]